MQLGQLRLAADQPCRLRWQGSARPRLCRPRLSNLVSQRTDFRRRRNFLAFQYPGKTIAAAWNGLDQTMLRPQRAPQRHHLHMQIVFLDHQPGPYPVQQLIFR